MNSSFHHFVKLASFSLLAVALSGCPGFFTVNGVDDGKSPFGLKTKNLDFIKSAKKKDYRFIVTAKYEAPSVTENVKNPINLFKECQENTKPSFELGEKKNSAVVLAGVSYGGNSTEKLPVFAYSLDGEYNSCELFSEEVLISQVHRYSDPKINVRYEFRTQAEERFHISDVVNVTADLANAAKSVLSNGTLVFDQTSENLIKNAGKKFEKGLSKKLSSSAELKSSFNIQLGSDGDEVLSKKIKLFFIEEDKPDRFAGSINFMIKPAATILNVNTVKGKFTPDFQFVKSGDLPSSALMADKSTPVSTWLSNKRLKMRSFTKNSFLMNVECLEYVSSIEKSGYSNYTQAAISFLALKEMPRFNNLDIPGDLTQETNQKKIEWLQQNKKLTVLPCRDEMSDIIKSTNLKWKEGKQFDDKIEAINKKTESKLSEHKRNEVKGNVIFSNDISQKFGRIRAALVDYSGYQRATILKNNVFKNANTALQNKGGDPFLKKSGMPDQLEPVETSKAIDMLNKLKGKSLGCYFHLIKKYPLYDGGNIVKVNGKPVMQQANEIINHPDSVGLAIYKDEQNIGTNGFFVLIASVAPENGSLTSKTFTTLIFELADRVLYDTISTWNNNTKECKDLRTNWGKALGVL